MQNSPLMGSLREKGGHIIPTSPGSYTMWPVFDLYFFVG